MQIILRAAQFALTINFVYTNMYTIYERLVK